MRTNMAQIAINMQSVENAMILQHGWVYIIIDTTQRKMIVA